jgi:hypothetical protein
VERRVGMKRLLIALIATVLLGSPADAQTKTDKERDGLAGPVLVVRLEKAKFVNESGEWKERAKVLSSVHNYDVKGNKTEWTFHRYDGTLDTKQINERDDKGRLIKVFFYKTNGSLDRKALHTYDEKGNLAVIDLVRVDGSPINKQRLGYSDNGKLVKADLREADGSIALDFDYFYDVTGRLIEVDYYRSLRFHYKVFFSFAYLDHKVFFSYNDKGIRNEGVEYTASGLVRCRDSWVYDDKGNMIETTHDDAEGSFNHTTSFSYEVDSYGNWIRGVVEMRDKAGTVISKDALYRTITYY